MSADNRYYPGTDVLRNRHDIRDRDLLAERERLEIRRALHDMRREPVAVAVDLSHYTDTHRRLFGRLYHWAGEPRSTDLWKSEEVLQGRSVAYSPPAAMVDDANYAFEQLRESLSRDILDNQEAITFSAAIAELWRSHPFEEGNTQTLLAFVEQFTRHRDQPIDQSIVSRAPRETHEALALATTGEVSNLSALFQMARRSEQERDNPQLGLLTSEAAEIMRLLAYPRIVQPEIAATIRGEVLATNYQQVIVRDERQVMAVSLRSFLEPPENNRRVVVRVIGPEETLSREDIAALQIEDRGENIVDALIPAALAPLPLTATRQERAAAAIEIPAPSQALAEALAKHPPAQIANDAGFLAEARTIEQALFSRFDPINAAIIIEGNSLDARKLLPPGQDLDALRAVLRPIQDTVLAAEAAVHLSQSLKQALSRNAPSMEQGR